MTSIASRPAAPTGLRLAAGSGLAWSLFGLLRFVTTAGATPAELAAGGMSEAQAALYAALPLWMNAAFAVGTIGGVIGCALLLLQRRAALPVLAASLAGYLVLYAGDIALGVFAAFGAPQIAILTSVVVIAAGLLWLAVTAHRRGRLA